MSLEQTINYQLNKVPGVKKVIKRVYQRTMVALSPRRRAEGELTRVSPPDPGHEYFFGYYDKCPEDATGRYVLCMRADDTWSEPDPAAPAALLLIDTQKSEGDPARVRVLGETRAWNVQQGCMLQWLGPDCDREVIYNDCRDGGLVSVVLDVWSGAERVLPAPVYSVAGDGSFALTLDFARLHNLRPGYGYSAVPERSAGHKLPDAPAIWRLDLHSGELRPLFSYRDFAAFEPRPEMRNAVHKLNHIMISPDGRRFMVLHRWFVGQRKYTRLVTADTEGGGLYTLSDDDMVSHCCWKNGEEILAFENKRGQGPGYYRMRDRTPDFTRLWPEMNGDGHPSYSPDGRLVVTDTYPNRARVASISVMNGESAEAVARVFAPFKYDNDTRCDLHPRWSRDGQSVYFDAVFEGSRGLYRVDVSAQACPVARGGAVRAEERSPKYSIITPVYNAFPLMARYFRSLSRQTVQDFEVILVDDCSTDSSYERLCEYAKESPLPLRVFRTAANGGPGLARNLGMDMARGEWIAFVDADDWLEERFLERIESTVSAHAVNAVIYDLYATDGKSQKPLRSMYRGEEGPVSLPDCIVNARNHAHGKVYRLSACREHGVRYPALRRCEDVAFVDRALVACGSVYYLKEPLYHYYTRPGSLSNEPERGADDMVAAFAVIERALAGAYPEELREKSVTDLLYGALLMMCKANRPSGEIRAYIDQYERRYPGWEQCRIIRSLGRGKAAFLQCAKRRNVAGMKAIAGVHSLLIAGGVG